jgi:hypothetical protein
VCHCFLILFLLFQNLFQIIRALLRTQGVFVTRSRVGEMLTRVNPTAAARRWSWTVARRVYHVPYPNSLWHIDGNMRLIRLLLPDLSYLLPDLSLYSFIFWKELQQVKNWSSQLHCFKTTVNSIRISSNHFICFSTFLDGALWLMVQLMDTPVWLLTSAAAQTIVPQQCFLSFWKQHASTPYHQESDLIMVVKTSLWLCSCI